MAEAFLWGAGGKKITPGQAAVLRQIAAQKSQVGTPSNLGEGLNAIGSALVSNAYNARAGEAETEGQQAVAAALAQAQASGDPNALYGIVADPWATEGQRMVAGTLLDKANMMEGRAYDEGLFGRTVDARLNAAQGLGLEGDQLNDYALTGGYDVASGATLPNAPSGYRYTDTGNLEFIPGGPDDPALAPPPKMDVTTKKEIFEADDAILAGQESLKALDQALALNDKAADGPFADAWSSTTAWLGGDDGKPETKKAIDTQNLKNIVMSNALNSLKAIFGAAPTEGERQILMDIQGSINQPISVRKTIFDRAKEAAMRRLQYNKEKSQGLRSGGYFQSAPAPGGNSSNAGPGWSVVGVE